MPDAEEVQAGMRHFLNNSLTSMSGIEDNILSRAAQLLRRFAPAPVYEAVWRYHHPTYRLLTGVWTAYAMH